MRVQNGGHFLVKVQVQGQTLTELVERLTLIFQIMVLTPKCKAKMLVKFKNGMTDHH
jgi:hypothetical protein